MFELKSLLFHTQEDAEKVLKHLQETAELRGQAYVMDFYELSGIESRYEDTRWAWSPGQLKNATIKQVDKDWTIDFPEPRPI